MPHNNATSLQVTSAALAGMIWAIENPRRGVIEPDEMDFERPLWENALDAAVADLRAVVQGTVATARRKRRHRGRQGR